MFFGAETMCPTSPVLPFHLSFFYLFECTRQVLYNFIRTFFSFLINVGLFLKGCDSIVVKVVFVLFL